MRDTHEPHDEFVERLAWKIGSEVRRRNREMPSPGWATSSRWKLVLAAAALVVVSMGIGGAVVAAAYEAQSNERRDLLVASYEQHLTLARQRVAMSRDVQVDAERRMDIGLASPGVVLEAGMKLADAEAQFKSLELQLAEVRLTGREPAMSVSAPLVSGRDFVSDRWRVEMTVPQARIALERARVQDAQRRFEVGVVPQLVVDTSRAALIEGEQAIQTLSRKLEIRQRFLKREIDPAEADLRVLEAEAEQRQRAFAQKIDLGRKEVQQIRTRFETGVTTNVELAAATLRLLELQTDLAKADLDLALIRKQLELKKNGK